MDEAITTDQEPDGDLIREVYATFGLAYYHSECLHRGLCMILAWEGLPPPDLITRPRVEELLANAFTLTLGDVAAKLEGVLPTELSDQLREAVDRRNFLAHHFWFERVDVMLSVKGVRGVIAELDLAGELFGRLDAKIFNWSERQHRELGLTDAAVQESLGRILAGKSEAPLPPREIVKGRQKKLSKRQRLIRVWEFALDDDRKPLIFELEDGSLWQLSDVGLGWTRIKEVGPEWTEHPAVKLHLPADIIPRPKRTGPWDYELALANRAVLWVKPGSKKQTFRWGVRVP